MSNRVQRIEESLRRAIADHLLFGGLRDPRLQGVNVVVTGVRVTPDLMQARVFVDILGEPAQVRSCLAALDAATPVIRAELARTIHLRRIPQLRFERDESIERGLRIEEALAEIRAADKARAREEVAEERPAEGADEGAAEVEP